MGKWLCCLVVVSLVFATSGMCLANGGVEKETPALKAVKEAPAAQTGVKSPGVAALISALVPGAGQIYNGDGLKAVIMCGAEVFSWLLVGTDDIEDIGFAGLIIGRVISPVDAYYSALEKNQGLSLRIDNEKVVVALKTNF